MRQIAPHLLWVGHAGDGSDFRHILDTGIQAVVQLAVEEPPLSLPRELTFCRFPLVDGAGNEPKVLTMAITTVANLLEQRVPTLICCGGGMSRSPAIAAAALSMVYQMTPEDSLKEVAQDHPADVVPALWQEIKAVLQSSALGFADESR
jgi:protein-tyrosine phosphatase